MKSIEKDPVIKKGTIIGWDWFYVVVEVTISGNVHCICDNANNIYPFTLAQILDTKEPSEWIILQPEEFEERYQFFADLEDEYKSLIEREIPYEVVAKSLCGIYDHRFSHWRT